MNKLTLLVLSGLIAITELLIIAHDWLFGVEINMDDMPEIAPRQSVFKTPFSDET